MLATSSLPHSLAIRFFKSNQIKQNKTEIRLPFKMSTTRSANKRIIILNQHEIFKEKDGLLRAIRLKHPKSDSLQPFLVISDQIYELVSYNQELGSVFIDDHVQSECATYFATKFNLVYFLISQCHARNSFVPLDQMLDSLLESDSDKGKKILGTHALTMKTLQFFLFFFGKKIKKIFPTKIFPI